MTVFIRAYFCFVCVISITFNGINNAVTGQIFQPFPDSGTFSSADNQFGPNRQPLDARTLQDRLKEERYRREENGWWNLYPFGEYFNDLELLPQPSLDTQIDLNFYYPYYGFRFNYSFIIPNGLIAFSEPRWIQPPYDFPNPRWPEERDFSFMAPFYAEATFQYVGETRISHVWYRTMHRPRFEGWSSGWITGNQVDQQPQSNQDFGGNRDQNTQRKVQAGYVEGNEFLDNVTRDIRNGIIGANGFQALHAMVVTWERMAYGGSSKVTEVNQWDQVKKWLNTYQLVIATDEIRSYAIFNYANVNWTSSSTAGSLSGTGGMQSAIAGFNAGNGTAFTPLPYSAQGQLYELARFTSGVMPGRWIYRVDEQIIRGGCSNESIGEMTIAPAQASFLGGITLNVSGPCIRPGDNVVILLDEFKINCVPINMAYARCIMPKFHKIGMIKTAFSADGGQSFPYFGTFYVIQPEDALPDVILVRDVINEKNNWDRVDAERLTMTWAPQNLTGDPSLQVNIELVGFWEDMLESRFERVGYIARNEPNDGSYEFDPRMIRTFDAGMVGQDFSTMWEKYNFGVIRVSVATTNRDQILEQTQGVLYSHLTPFAWYFRQDFENNYGNNWAVDRCIEWFEYDGRLRNYWVDIPPCPCILDQAYMDIGRFMPVPNCNRQGDSGCPYHRGAQHCVMAVQATWTGAQQVCCYDFQGWLMMSDDYESPDYLEYFSPGVPWRAATYGSYPFKFPPRIPSLSNWYEDIMPYYLCCKYAKQCEFYFWRRLTHGCMGYQPPVAAFAYGEPHFITFDGTQYTFNGKGYYVLTTADHPEHTLTVQVRMEQPPMTVWGQYPNATVITGVAVKENKSDVVQILARKPFREWRYRMDVLVNGVPRYFDRADMKWQLFTGVSLYSPPRNMNQSEIVVQLTSGAGIRVTEAYGQLAVAVFLPPSFNVTRKVPSQVFAAALKVHSIQTQKVTDEGDRNTQQAFVGDMRNTYRTYGLLGYFDGDQKNDLMTPTGTLVTKTTRLGQTESESRSIYLDFGQKWKSDGSEALTGSPLFQTAVKPIYNPQLFISGGYVPQFIIDTVPFAAQFVFTLNEVRDVCQNNYACSFDYVSTGVRQLAENTLNQEQDFKDLKERGSVEVVSCGALLKAMGAMKTPIGNNYLDGVTVTFACKPDYFLHGTEQRTCINGTWSPGWHVWCRSRAVEWGLKWFTGIAVSLTIMAMIVFIFLSAYMLFVKPKAKVRHHASTDPNAPPDVRPERKKPEIEPEQNNVELWTGRPPGYQESTETTQPLKNVPAPRNDFIRELDREPGSGFGRSPYVFDNLLETET